MHVAFLRSSHGQEKGQYIIGFFSLQNDLGLFRRGLYVSVPIDNQKSNQVAFEKLYIVTIQHVIGFEQSR